MKALRYIFAPAVATIAAHELRALFVSPVAWIMLALVQIVVGIVFVTQLQVFLDPPKAAALSQSWGMTRVVAAPLFNWAAFLLTVVVPVLSMRSLSEERRSRTMMLYLGAPITSLTIVLGKFCGLVLFLWVQVALVALLPLLLLLGGDLDLGLLGAQVLGLSLLCLGFAALGICMSSLTKHPPIAALATLAVLMLSWILSWRGPGGATSELAQWIHYLSWQAHLEPMLRGWVDSADVAFFAIVAMACLCIAVLQVTHLRDGD